MRKILLLPTYFKATGWIILVPSIILGCWIIFLPDLLPEQSNTAERIFNNVAIIGTIIGALFVGFSRDRHEDEMLVSIRLNSLLIATYINYGALAVASLFVYDLQYLNIMACNIATLLLIYLIVLHYSLYRLKKSLQNEE